MFVKSVVFLCIYFLLLAAADKNKDAEHNNNCKRNEEFRKIVSCEKACSDGNEKCKLMTRCICKEKYYRNKKTGECVEKEKCSLYPGRVIKDKTLSAVATSLDKASPHLPEKAGDIASKAKSNIGTYQNVKKTVKD